MKPIIFTLLALLAGSCSMTAAADGITVTGAARVLDGDTVAIGKQKIRLRGIDAPEREQLCWPYSGGTAACGRQAATVLKMLIADRPLNCAVVDTDRYGRSVALCRAGQTDINREMVLRGWAVAYWTDDFKNEEQQAKAAKRGIWDMRFKQPEDYRHPKKGG